MNRARQFLREYVKRQHEIRRLESQIEELRAQAESVTAWTDSDRVQSSHKPDKIGEIVAEIADLEREWQDEKIAAIDAINDITSTIRELEDPVYSDLLELKYIRCYAWERVADELNYSPRWTQELHGRALAELEKLL